MRRVWIIFRKGFVRRLIYMAFPLVAIGLLSIILDTKSQWYNTILHIIWIWFVVSLVLSVNGMLGSAGQALLSKASLHGRPLKGFIQILQVLVACIGAIIVVSIIIGKSPLTLITGLGAFAAVLMLVFKDSILGFVAGVLLSENDMIHIGDWIEIPSNNVNGIVQDVSLTIVKVRNWDNTIVTVPPYSLISESFVNWRGMTESAGRRITRSITLMYDYIKPCTPEFLERIKRFDTDLSNFIAQKQLQEMKGEVVDTHNPEGLVDGSITTNVGLLRAYLSLYLRRHPAINTSLDLMIRSLPPTDNGLPIQLYCFSSNKIWAEYESIQAGIMEHVISVLPVFELHAYQSSSSRDNIINGLLEGGYDANNIHNIPWGVIK